MTEGSISLNTKKRLAISFDVEATGDTPATASCNMIGFVGVLEETVPAVGKNWIVFKNAGALKNTTDEASDACVNFGPSIWII